jgi:hypothetical protein
MNYDRIIEAAKIYSGLAQSDDAQECEQLIAQVDTLGDRERALAHGIGCVLNGGTHNVLTDRTETLEHYLSASPTWSAPTSWSDRRYGMI